MIGHEPPLLFNLDEDPFEQYPLDTNLYSGVIHNAKRKVVEHKQSIVEVPRQLEKLDPNLQPCCNPPSCTCGYTSGDKDEL